MLHSVIWMLNKFDKKSGQDLLFEAMVLSRSETLSLQLYQKALSVSLNPTILAILYLDPINTDGEHIC